MSQVYLRWSREFPDYVRRLEESIEASVVSRSLGEAEDLLGAITQSISDEQDEKALRKWIKRQLSMEINNCLQDEELDIDLTLDRIKQLNELMHVG